MGWPSRMTGRTWCLLSPVRHNSRKLRWPPRPVAKKEHDPTARRMRHRTLHPVAPPFHTKGKRCLPAQIRRQPLTEPRNYGKTSPNRLLPHCTLDTSSHPPHDCSFGNAVRIVLPVPAAEPELAGEGGANYIPRGIVLLAEKSDSRLASHSMNPSPRTQSPDGIVSRRSSWRSRS